jgi:hypothetical protein
MGYDVTLATQLELNASPQRYPLRLFSFCDSFQRRALCILVSCSALVCLVPLIARYFYDIIVSCSLCSVLPAFGSRAVTVPRAASVIKISFFSLSRERVAFHGKRLKTPRRLKQSLMLAKTVGCSYFNPQTSRLNRVL